MSALVLGLHLFSLHAPALPEQNNVNLGAYVRHESGFTAGVYRNTLDRTSMYAGYTIGDRVALTIGVVSGYQKEIVNGDVVGASNGKLMLMLAPSVRLGPVRLSYIPRVGSTNPCNVFHFSVEKGF
jgi:hypothetical protein